jgi:hypothetical protein
MCPNCNNHLLNESRFCSNCGYLLEIKCDKCDTVSAINNKYCSNCGSLLTFINSKRHQKRSNINNIKKKKKPIQKSNNKTLIISTIGVLLGIFLVYQFYKDQEVGQHFNLTENKSNDIYTELKVIEIASKFNCSCGTCGITPLETCTCNIAIQERQYIRNALQNGQKVQKITEEIQDNYGSMKPEFLNESL